MHRRIASRDSGQRAKEMMTYISFHPVLGNLETMQNIRRGETPLRHSAASFGDIARKFYYLKVPFRHRAIFGECFTIQHSETTYARSTFSLT